MSIKERTVKELRSIFWTSLYFFTWFGVLMIFKVLLLEEYMIEFFGLTAVIVGALVVAKVVLIMEYIPIPFTKGKPAYLDIISRTLIYLAGVVIILVLEKSIEARHEYGGVMNAFKNLKTDADKYHIWVNTISVCGALLFYNIWSVVKKHFGKGIFRKLMFSPIPMKAEREKEAIAYKLENIKT
jgi:hypothetical protein